MAALAYEAARQREHLRRQAATDGLTGMLNHRGSQERLRREIEAAATSGEPLSVAVVDLDHFKRINDSHGHAEGDKALARPAAAWAPLSPQVAATADVHEGVRVAAAAGRGGAVWARALAELGDDLAVVTETAQLVTAGRHARPPARAEDVSLMWVVDDALELLSDNKEAPGERWERAEFPATSRLLDAQTPGQVVVGDPESDPDEIAELERLGYGAVLMVPVRCGLGRRALVEVYRIHPQAFTSTEVDRARVVAQQFGPVLARLATTPASP